MKLILRKILWTLAGIFIYRCGTFITIPFVNAQLIATDTMFIQNKLLTLFTQYSIGKFDNASIFALGLGPYINSSILCQALFYLVPALVEKKKREGSSIVNKYTKNLTLPLILLQGSFFVRALWAAAQNNPAILEVPVHPLWFTCVSLLSLMMGTLFLISLGSLITHYGIGSGTSVLLAVTCLNSLASDLVLMQEEHKLWLYLLILVSSVAFITAVETAQRQIPLLYPQSPKGLKVLRSFHTVLPLKINQAGVIPPIFANTVVSFLQYGLGALGGLLSLQATYPFFAAFEPIIKAVLIVVMSFIYTDIVFHPEDIANYLQRPLGVIPTIRPGTNTATYIQNIATKLTLIGGLYVIFVSFAPLLIAKYVLGINNYQIGFSGSSLLIAVVVVIEIISKISTQIVTTKSLHSAQLL